MYTLYIYVYNIYIYIYIHIYTKQDLCVCTTNDTKAFVRPAFVPPAVANGKAALAASAIGKVAPLPLLQTFLGCAILWHPKKCEKLVDGQLCQSHPQRVQLYHLQLLRGPPQGGTPGE